ncbi:50S ribosomal protein L9 [Ructibacterium gallinarum]|uniref:Large ribosomal subunit protein bL9 n=1 Tax=Ructibacterium gallinarum TaxID=2779355 RepID=A0A9D5R8R4_9FIRM|nr:50S ribosomal protein L9 [Ructibacterium gallinarum]MBE5040270.1 50S ribosomal protein L9 [Ructibacterium gallinarum]
MKVILTQDVKSQGKKGDLINVSDGYANNFLLPKGLAKLATKQALNELEGKRGAEQYKRNQEEMKAANIAERMKDIKVKLTAKAGKEGKLFGSVTSKDVAQALKDQFHIEVDKRKIDLPDGIKVCGIREVSVTLYPGIVGTFRVEVTEQQ